MNSWILGGGPQNDIILSSRIRLARNLSDMPFPLAGDAANSEKIIDIIRNSSMENDYFKEFKFINIKDINKHEKLAMVEKHLVSLNLIAQGTIGAAIVKDDEIVSIMINEEDHIRIQAILPGLQIKNAWEIANEVDDKIENSVEYAFDEKWGYLTCCPTNVGTGLRASVMIHLPALNITGNINKILHTVTQIGMTIRGIYGEGTEFVGNIFQISNQITLGRSEEELIDNLTAVTEQIIDKEREARNMLLNSNKIQLEDKIWRSLGTMKNARIMKSQECMKLLSDIRLGIDLDIIESMPIALLNEMMIETQPASIQKYAGSDIGQIESDILRAEIIRKRINKI